MHQTLVFAGPSAVGKTHVANELLKQFPESFEQAKVYTTRPPRKNEKLVDRVIVSEDQFSQMITDGDFLIHGVFGDHKYGFTNLSLHPNNKHLLINTWPLLVPEFSKLKNTIIIGIQAPENNIQILTNRMKRRGDSEEVISKRLELITKDAADLKKFASFLKIYGAFFIIEDDDTIQKKIIPWITEKLAL